MKKGYVALLWSLWIGLIACDKEEAVITDTNQVNQWIEETMRTNYLWYEELPDKSQLDFSADPETFFNSLLSDKDGKVIDGSLHHFSTIEKAASTKTILDANDSYGFDFAVTKLKVSNGETHNIAVVIYVLPNSPAAEAGLRRGDWILGVNGELGSISDDYNSLRSGAEARFYIADYDREKKSFINARDLSLSASRAVEDTPFLKDSIYHAGGKTVGYLMYNHFASDPDGYKGTAYNEQMTALFARFKQQGVNEFVLDLRYNGGGLLSCAQLLASFLAPSSALGQVFCKEVYNDLNQAKNQSVKLLRTTEVLAGNLNLQRLYVLTGSSTASSSELVINGLRPFMGQEQVRLIGRTTLGKTVGMTIYDQSAKYGWILQPITFYVFNAEDKADYRDGFTPDVEINEYEQTLAPFGTADDPLFAQAMAEITGTANLKAVQAPAIPFALKEVNVRKGRGMISDL